MTPSKEIKTQTRGKMVKRLAVIVGQQNFEAGQPCILCPGLSSCSGCNTLKSERAADLLARPFEVGVV
jgi:hypothetical protein